MPNDFARELTLRVRTDGSQLKNLGADFERVGNRAKGAGQEAEGAGQRVRKFFGNLPGAAKAAAGLFLIHQAFTRIKQVLSDSISLATNYEASLARMVALAGVAREQVALWEGDLKDLAPRLGRDLLELSDAMFFIASAGFRGAEGMEILEGSGKAAATGLGETKDIANLTTSALKAYADEGLNAAEATDILLASTREGKGEASEYARSLAEVLLPAKLANVEFSELAGSAALLTRLTPNVAVVGTQLKALFIGIQKPSQQGAEALTEAHEAGVVTIGTFGELRDLIRRDGLIAGLEELGKIREELGDEFFNRLFESQEGRQALNALLNDLDETRATMDAVADSSGAVNDAFAEVSKTAAFQNKVLKQELNVAMVDFGNLTLPLVTGGVKGLITVVNLLSDAFKALYNGVKGVFEGISESISNTTDRLLGFLGRLPRNAGDSPPPSIASLVTAAGGDVGADPLAANRYLVGPGAALYRRAAADAADETVKETARAAKETTEVVKESVTDMVDEVEEASDLMENFWADTMSQMRNSASSLFFDVMTGKFSDLGQLAEGTFRGILRTASHYFGQLATQRLALNIVPNVGGAGGAGAAGAGGLISRIPGFAPGERFGGSGLLNSGTANFLGGAFGVYNIASSLFSGDIAGGVGAGIGGGIGAGIGSAIPGLGTLVGFGIGSAIGKLIGGFFKKKPRLDIDIDTLVPGSDVFAVDDILRQGFAAAIKIGSRKTGVDYGQLREAIGEALRGTIGGIRDIIERLPEEVQTTLDELLLKTAVDTREHFGRDRLLEFDVKGKKIKEELEKFLGGELQSRFLFSIRDFFEGAFAQLGVLPDRAREFVDEQFERFKAAGSREERAAIGQELLALFEAGVEIYNGLEGRVLTPLEAQLQAAERAAAQFGFGGIPSLEEVDKRLGEVFRDLEDPQLLVGLAGFREQLRRLREDLAGGLTDVSSRIRGSISAIAEFGKLLGRDFGERIIGALTRNVHALQAVIADSTISLDRRTAALAEQGEAVRQLTAIERAAFEESKRLRLEALNSELQAVEDLVDAQRRAFEESKRLRLEALNSELQAVEDLRYDFTGVLKGVGNAIRSLNTGAGSPLSPAERLQAVRGEISALQARVPGARGADLAYIQEQLTRLLPESVRIAREGFGEGSSAASAAFTQAQEGLRLIQEQTLEELVTQESLLIRQNELVAEIKTARDSQFEVESGLLRRQNELAAEIKAVEESQFEASKQLQALIDTHLSNQLALQEELNSLQGQIYDEIRKGNSLTARLTAAIQDLARRPVNVTLDRRALGST